MPTHFNSVTQNNFNMKTNRNLAAQLLRNTKALYKRLVLSIRHNDADEIIKASVLLIENAGWLLCVISTLALIVVGFFKPHCFITAFVSYILSGIIRANIEDNKKAFPLYEMDK